MHRIHLFVCGLTGAGTSAVAASGLTVGALGMSCRTCRRPPLVTVPSRPAVEHHCPMLLSSTLHHKGVHEPTANLTLALLRHTDGHRQPELLTLGAVASGGLTAGAATLRDTASLPQWWLLSPHDV